MHIAVRAASLSLFLSLRERMDFPSNNNRGPHVIGVARTEPASEVSDRPWFTTVAQLFTYLYIHTHTHSLIYTRLLSHTAVCVFKWPVAPRWLCSSLAPVGKRSRTRIWQRTHFFGNQSMLISNHISFQEQEKAFRDERRTCVML
jgi:hypothetical protein